LMMIVEHNKDTALKAIQRNPPAYEWVENYWCHYFSIDPQDKSIHVFRDGKMVPFEVPEMKTPRIADISRWVQSSRDNLPMAIIERSAK
jgi:hypothetical protein